jgi:UDP-2,4-diacetamido-2,4,6-trideoxy-beta-L-altropyranose hydrolase
MFRVDGSPHIGMGHIMRCLTLAKEFKANGYLIYFFSINYNNNVKSKILSLGFNVIDLPDIGLELLDDMRPAIELYQIQDSRNCKSNINIKFNFVFVDNYRLNYIWEKEILGHCEKIIVIDDLANRKHKCDYLIDQSFNRNELDYQDLIENGTNLLMGLKYAILRKEFLDCIPKAKKKRKLTVEIKKVLVCFGGGDNTDIIIKSVDSLINCDFYGVIQISVTENCSGINRIKDRYKYKKNILIDVNSIPMPLKILDADLSIGAFGSMSWERCSLGLPTISIKIADNQEYIAKSLDDAGVIVRSNITNLSDNIKQFMDGKLATKKWHYVSNRSFDMCDALGVDRILFELNVL